MVIKLFAGFGLILLNFGILPVNIKAVIVLSPHCGKTWNVTDGIEHNDNGVFPMIAKLSSSTGQESVFVNVTKKRK